MDDFVKNIELWFFSEIRCAIYVTLSTSKLIQESHISEYIWRNQRLASFTHTFTFFCFFCLRQCILQYCCNIYEIPLMIHLRLICSIGILEYSWSKYFISLSKSSNTTGESTEVIAVKDTKVFNVENSIQFK